MKTIYCYNNQGIKFQTINESEFSRYQIQSYKLGLQCHIGEFFPFKREASGMLTLNADGRPIELSDAEKFQLGIISESEVKEILKSKIRSKIDSITNSVQANYTSAEKQSFAVKELEANEFHLEKRSQVDCIVLTNEAKAIFGNSFSATQFGQIVARVRSKSLQFKTLIGTLSGIRSRLEARIDSGEYSLNIDSEFSGIGV
ncbi:MAG: hypothetical protein L6Q54_14810 [Leptospiraceae bacterium]|nr:hypothetical protein [Leptospiraceae bacterium]MCK6382505.1 hypothetical protein [Leptospiraceae bacterium]NUM42942.1 hypothetical protein [Leptospiraceae bacterium]